MLALLLAVGFTAFAEGADEEAAVDTERPIWLWGMRGGNGAEFTQESLKLANEWALEKFGHTFRLTTRPGGGITRIQGINIMLSEGNLPDVVNVGPYDVAAQKMIVDMAKFGKSMAVDKYYNDPENYPNLYKIGQRKDSIMGLLWNGKMYALPAYYTALNTSPSYNGIEWWIRWDALKGYKGNTLENQAWVPKTLNDVYTFAKYADGLGLVDHEGRPSYAFGISFYRNQPNEWSRVIKTLQGAGWEVDDQMRLLPYWASEEMYDALAWVNMMHREGLMHPNWDMLDGQTNMEHRSTAMPLIHAGMENWGPSNRRRQIYDKNDQDFDEAAKDLHWDTFYMCVVPPILKEDGSIGAFYTIFPQVTIAMKSTPNPEALFKLVDWCFTNEAIPTMRLNVGPIDINFQWTRDWEKEDINTYYYRTGEFPMLWTITGYDEPLIRDENGAPDWTATYMHLSPCPDKIAFDGEMGVEGAKECPPRVLPWVIDLFFPTYTHYSEYFAWNYHVPNFIEMGIPIDGREGTWTATHTDWELHHLIKDTIEAPKPSYLMVLYDMTPLEAGAFATAEQRFDESLSQVLTSDTAADFEKNYEALLNQLLRITNWKPVYEKRQKNWEDWIDKNKVDDRAELQSVTPRPEWNEVMGW